MSSFAFLAVVVGAMVQPLGVGLLAAQGTNRAELVAAIDSIAMAGIEDGRAAGMSIAVVRGTDTLLVKAYGSADLELDAPTPEDAVYEIGSVTKQFTAAAILLLQEDGKLSLEDDLTRWLPDYPSGGRSITVRRLLDHTSGIKGYTEMPAFGQIATQTLPRDSLVALFAAEPFDFEPGEALIYNNSAYFLLGLIIQEASAETYEDFVEERLFAAAGMESSRYCHKDELTPRRTKGYQPGPDGLRSADYLNHLWPYSAGSLCSTARDLVVWNQAVHGDGGEGGGGLLSSESYAELIVPGTLKDGAPVRYAKGLTITDRDGAKRIGHGGGIFGYLSELRYFPHADLSIVVLINTAGPVGPSAIAEAIEDLVLGPVAPVRPRAFGGDVDAFLGTFRGPARGRRLTVEVTRGDDGELMIKTGAAEAQPVRWLGGSTFARGPTRFTFVIEDGRAAVLRVDQVTGVYVLARSEG